MQSKGYLTVYLSLVLGVILSLLVALIEGAAIGATRLQAELVADLGMDSIFAEYHRELLEQYGVFYIDDSYGNEQGSLARVEQHLTDYMSYNCNPFKDQQYSFAKNLIKLKNTYLEIEEVSFATDDNGAVWKAQAIEYIKQYYGVGYLDNIQSYVNVVNENGLATTDLMSELSQKREEMDSTLDSREEEDPVETDTPTEQGNSYDQITGLLDNVLGTGVLSLVASDVSEKTIVESDYISHRSANQGNGLREGVDDPDGIMDALVYDEYLMQKYGNYLEPKENSALDYEIEYILCGRDSDAANLRVCAERLLALRTAANFIYLNQTDTAKKTEVQLIATLIASLLKVPPLKDVLTYVLLVIWANVEAFSDVKCLLDGGKVPLMKQKGEWNTDLSGLLENGFRSDNAQSNTSESGLDYQTYLRIFLALMIGNDKVMRSMDVVEMDIRLTDGNEHFRIDRCISYLKVNFRFEDAKGHEYVFTREMGYQ